ncbi:MAG TPA: hypothetical protein VM097_03670, partial [Mycobacteriales bacterium]|nr:hypothetical protein [Mycobacteriales bacterium]
MPDDDLIRVPPGPSRLRPATRRRPPPQPEPEALEGADAEPASPPPPPAGSLAERLAALQAEVGPEPVAVRRPPAKKPAKKVAKKAAKASVKAPAKAAVKAAPGTKVPAKAPAKAAAKKAAAKEAPVKAPAKAPAKAPVTKTGAGARAAVASAVPAGAAAVPPARAGTRPPRAVPVADLGQDPAPKARKPPPPPPPPVAPEPVVELPPPLEGAPPRRNPGWVTALLALTALLLVAAAGLGAGAFVARGEKTWSSTAPVRFLPPAGGAADSAVANYLAQLPSLTDGATSVARVPSGDVRDDLRGRRVGSDQLEVTAHAADPDQAERLAAAGAEAVVARVAVDQQSSASPPAERLRAVVAGSAEEAERTRPSRSLELVVGLLAGGTMLLIVLLVVIASRKPRDEARGSR